MTTLLLALGLLGNPRPPEPVPDPAALPVTRPHPDPAPRAPAYKVLHAFDGDTLVLLVGTRTAKVRLLGVAPVPGSEPANRRAASWFLLRLLENESVSLRYEGAPRRERDGRFPAQAFRARDGLCVNAELIARGYGTVAPADRFVSRPDYLAREREAREGSRGLWSEPIREEALREYQSIVDRRAAEFEEKVARRREAIEARRQWLEDLAAQRRAAASRSGDREKSESTCTKCGSKSVALICRECADRGR